MVAVWRANLSDARGNICSHMRRTPTEFEEVKKLMAEGIGDYRIEAMTGIPRSTVRTWRDRQEFPRAMSRAVGWQVNDAAAYCYVLGCYLGDGHVTHRTENSWELRLACDQRYPEIMSEMRSALSCTFPGSEAAAAGASDVLRISHPGVREAFPQHGPGRKHLRRIVLTDWQRELTHAHPAALLRGLIHTDGCRAVNQFQTKLPSGRIAEYRYIRYFFSNRSRDIRDIFVEHCHLLGIRVTQSNPRNLSIAHRHSVAILEEIVGTKT